MCDDASCVRVCVRVCVCVCVCVCVFTLKHTHTHTHTRTCTRKNVCIFLYLYLYLYADETRNYLSAPLARSRGDQSGCGSQKAPRDHTVHGVPPLPATTIISNESICVHCMNDVACARSQPWSLPLVFTMALHSVSRNSAHGRKRALLQM